MEDEQKRKDCLELVGFGPSLRNTFEYDAAGNTTRRLIETYDNAAGDWINRSLRMWSYDGNGEETEDLEQGWDAVTSAWVNEHREVTTWTSDSSNPTEMAITAQDWDPLASGGLGGWANRDRGILTIVSATEWVQTEQDWDSAAGDWVNRLEESIKLDSNGDFVEFVSRAWDPAANGGMGDWVNEDRSSFVRNEQGLVVENTNKIWDGAMWVNESRLLQTYDEFTGTVVENESPELAFRLSANYPNPFSRETRIQFALPQADHVILEVFDMLGRRVTTLVDGLVAPGQHQVTLDASGMAGGLYVYRLEGGNVNISRTMLLVP